MRLNRPAATGLIWFWALLEAGNSIGHLTLAATRGGSFPDGATAPLLLFFAGWLLALQVRRNDTSRAAKWLEADTILANEGFKLIG